MCKTLPKLIALLIVFSECLIVCFCLHSQISTKASTPLQQQASRSLNSEERRLPLCFSRKALIDASVTAGLNLLLAGAVTSPAHAIPFFNARFDTADDVPKDYFDRHRSIYAFCERVIDGDTIRVRHIPGYSVFGAFQASELEPLSSRGIADKTLILRLYGVDTPEVAKPSNGNTGQPFSQQAKEYTADLVYQRVVKVTFLKKDQYRRAVSQVETLPKFRFLSFLPGFGSRDVSIELAAAGLAELYTGGGAEYNGNRETLETWIRRARRSRKGIWSLGDERVSASDFKRESASRALDLKVRTKSKRSRKVPSAATFRSPVATM